MPLVQVSSPIPYPVVATDYLVNDITQVYNFPKKQVTSLNQTFLKSYTSSESNHLYLKNALHLFGK